jgi:hypothetical protein
MIATHIVDVNKEKVTECKRCKKKDCNHDCQNSLCSNVSIEILRPLLFKIKIFLADYGVGVAEQNNFGYTSKKVCDKDAAKAIKLSKIIQKKYLSLLQKESVCFCDSVVDSTIQRLNELLPVSCNRFEEKDYINKDEKGLALWIKNSPNCISFEKWERALHNFTHEFKFDIQKVDCEISYNFLVSNVNCDLVANLTAIKQAGCDLKASFETQKEPTCKVNLSVEQVEKCKIDYEVLSEETGCKLKVDTYVDLIECGISHEIISELVKCNLDFEVTQKEIKVKTETSSISADGLDIDVIEYLLRK